MTSYDFKVRKFIYIFYEFSISINIIAIIIRPIEFATNIRV